MAASPRASDVASRLQLLSSAPKQDRQQIQIALLSDVKDLGLDELVELLSLCEHTLPRRNNKQAIRFLARACTDRDDLLLDSLISSGVSISVLAVLARHVHFSDLPPNAELLDRLLALMLTWEPMPDNTPGGGPLASLLLAISGLELGEWLRSAEEPLLRHGFNLELGAAGGAGRVQTRVLSEAGEVLPAWRRALLRRAVHPDLEHAFAPADLVRLAQDWSLYDDEVVLGRLQLLLGQDSPSSNRRAGPRQEGPPAEERQHLPVLTLAEETLVMVDSPESEQTFREATEAAFHAVAEGETLLVALDAEWQDPRPLSLLQLAVSVAGGPVTVFLVDMVAQLSSLTLSCCSRLLRVRREDEEHHKVIAFGSREDRRRLALAGILPEGAQSKAATNGVVTQLDGEELTGWIDLQQPVWGLGAQPSLRTVVEKVLESWLDKRLQQSRWDRRPLSQEQMSYAALDASVLLRLYLRWQALPQSKDEDAESSVAVAAVAVPLRTSLLALTPEEEKARWARRRSQLRDSGQAAEGDTKSINGDLRFAVVMALTKLARKMRGLGLDSTIISEDAGSRVTKQLIQAARDEGRIILTRSRRMNLPDAVLESTYLLRSDNTDEQLREIIEVFDVEVHPDCLCGRCSQCNAWDWRAASREDMIGNPQVNEKTLEFFEEFWVCGGCQKVFWEGGMFEKAVAHLRTFMPAALEAGGAHSSQGEAPEAQDQSKYTLMEEEGCSAQRIRAQMVRDGALQPGTYDRPVSRTTSDAGTSVAAAGTTAAATASRTATATFVQTHFSSGVSSGLDATAAVVAALKSLRALELQG